MKMNSHSHSPVLPSQWETDRLQEKSLTLHIPRSPPLIARVVPPCRAEAVLVNIMGNGRHPDVANRAGKVMKIDNMINMHDSEDEDREEEEESGDEDVAEDDTEESDREEADQEEVDTEEADTEEADQEGHTRGAEKAYVHSASDQPTFTPRDWRRDQAGPHCGDLDQTTKRHTPRVQDPCIQAQARSSSHRSRLPTLQPAASGRGAAGSDGAPHGDVGRLAPSTQRARSEQGVWAQRASPAPSLSGAAVNLDARALVSTTQKPGLAANGTIGERTPEPRLADGNTHVLPHTGAAHGGEHLQSSTPKPNFLAAPNVVSRENDQVAETGCGRSPRLAVPVGDRLNPSSHAGSQNLASQSRRLDPTLAMARYNSSSSSSATLTPSRRDEAPAASFGTVSRANSTSSYSPVDPPHPYSPQGFSQNRTPGQFQPISPRQHRHSLPPLHPLNLPSHLDSETNSLPVASGTTLSGVDNSQQQRNLPSIREVIRLTENPLHHSTPVSPNTLGYSQFPPHSGVGENYPTISRRATTDCSGGMGDPVPPARDTLQPLRRVATAPKYPSLAPQTDNDSGSGAHRSQPTIAAAISQPHAPSQPGQHAPAPAGGYVCPEPNCKALPFLTQYQLSSHANVHSSERPHFCSVPECPHSKPGHGFKRKNEMIRHGLVHRSPGYTCPFCPGRKHKYPRRDNLRRHVRGAHKDKSKDDPLLLNVLAQRPEGPNGKKRPAA